MTSPTRFLTLRPPAPTSKKRRAADVARAKARRTEKRMVQAMAEADTTATNTASGGAQRVDLVGFTKWFATLKDQGYLDVLTEPEQDAFRQAAWAVHHKALAPGAWLEVLKAIREKMKDAATAAEVARYHRVRPFVGGPQGW